MVRAAWMAAAALAPLGFVVELSRLEPVRSVWRSDGNARVVFCTTGLSVAAACWGGVRLGRLLPANRCGMLGSAVGSALAAFYVTNYAWPREGWWPVGTTATVFALRPLLAWLVLAWPTGRLDRSGRLVLDTYVVAAAAVFVVELLEAYPADDWANDPVRLWRPSTWTVVLHSLWWDVAGLVFAVALLVVGHRRTLLARGRGLGVERAGWLAVVITAGADLVLMGTGPIRDLTSHAGHVTAFGLVVQVVDLARWGAVVVVLAWSTSRLGHATSEPRRFDVDAGVPLDAALADAFADPTVRVLVRSGDGWADSEGVVTAAPSAGTMVASADGTPVATIVHAADLALHPAVLEAAAATIALQIDAIKQRHDAEARTLQLEQLASSVTAAEREALVALERDLHDGAQQTLVGLALQARLASRSGGTGVAGLDAAARDLGKHIASVQDLLVSVSGGHSPALLAERGLAGALAALAATAGIPVAVHVEAGADASLGPRLERTLWFVASEAVANAIKHAGADRIDIRLAREDAELVLTVADDGGGGLQDVPAALAARVADVGGKATIRSQAGAGTTVTARFPAAVLVPA